MYKIETHLHTSEVSGCGQLRAADMIKRYHAAGYDTVFVTDHFQTTSLDPMGDISWEDKITIFLSGYYRAKAMGDKLGITVLPAAEITFAGSPNHYLAYGITRAFLNAHPDLNKLTIEEFADIAREHHLFLIQAHPFRDGHCYPTPEFVQGFEICNSNPRHNDENPKAAASAAEHGMLITGGSDAHRVEDVARSGIRSPFPIRTTEDYIRLLQEGVGEIFEEEPV